MPIEALSARVSTLSAMASSKGMAEDA
eukprot:SAG31_NODE_3595_length_4088_cov_2.210078_5_plen_26_part_01